MRIGQYHQDVPDWRQTAKEKPGQLVGVELEVYHKKGRQLAADALDDIDFGKYPVPFAERDGSICQTNGVEIICPPLPLDEATDDNGYMSRLMGGLFKAGVTGTPADNYGMHVNINLADWKPKEKVIVQFLLNKFEKEGIIIGGRSGKGCGGFHPVFKYTAAERGILRLSTFFGDKHCAAWIRQPARGLPAGGEEGRVMEVRFPKSTLDITQLRKVIDYVFALRQWTAAAPNHTEACCFLSQLSGGASTALSDSFLNWCAKYKPQVAAAIKPELTYTKQPARLVAVQEALGNVTDRSLTITGLINDTNSSAAEQALRISTLISKGAKLQGQRSIQEYGLTSAASVRAAS